MSAFIAAFMRKQNLIVGASASVFFTVYNTVPVRKFKRFAAVTPYAVYIIFL